MTKIALITGASRGLGAALSEALCKTHHIVAVARTVGALEELDDRIQSLGGAATLAPMNVTDSQAMAHLCRGIFDRWGRVDVWCHTAIHAPPLAPADHVAAKDMEKTLATNVTATAALIPMVAPLLRAAERGTAVFFDDPHLGEKFFGTYATGKTGQMALARAWAAETERLAPRVVIHTPAPMPTATRARFFPGEDRGALANPQDEAAKVLAALADLP